MSVFLLQRGDCRSTQPSGLSATTSQPSADGGTHGTPAAAAPAAASADTVAVTSRPSGHYIEMMIAGSLALDSRDKL